jgi:5-methylthioadenosine/S-adenosylhomocysteine deaminase
MTLSTFDTLLYGCQILTIDARMTIHDLGSVVVEKGLIVYAGPSSSLPEEWKFRNKIDLTGKIVMPAFFNSHNHAAMSIFRGLGNDLSLNEWLNHFIWPAESRNINPDTVYLGTMISALEMIRSGTAIFSDMYFFEEEVARACEDIGMRVILGEGILDFPTPDKTTPYEAMKHIRNLHHQFKNHPLVSVSVAVHAPYTCSPEVVSKAAELSKNLNITANVHLAETSEEIHTIHTRYGKSPVRYLYDLGFLSERTVAHHGIYLSEEDMELIFETGTSIATIPNSNMKLGSGVCPVPDLIKKGINVSIGTDGAASNNNQSMLRELQQLLRLQKVVHRDPTIITAEEVIRMATINGAIAYGMENVTGSIEPGKQADLLVINPDQPHWYPRYNPYISIAYSMQSSDVESLMVGGEFIVRNHECTKVDEQELLGRIKAFRLVQ